MFRLDGRAALVTGAGSGIGAAVAAAFEEAGAAVLVTDVDQQAAKNTAERVGGKAEYRMLDVRDRAAADEAARRAAELGDGTLHILVNNAGAIAPAMFGDLTEEAFRRILDIHLVGSFVCSQAALPYLPGDGTGRIINVTSAAGLTGTIGQANYGAAKAGIIGLTKSLARELARHQIRANAVSIALVQTDSLDAHTGGTDEERMRKILAQYPLRRLGRPEDVVPMVLLRASPLSSWTTGQIISVNGGYAMP
jgi:3-oxoacyl-[acyl-carrier protein] reductase